MTHGPSHEALADPELTKLLGEIYAVWEEIEQKLYQAFEALLPVNWTIARAIFFVHVNHRARRDMLMELAKAVWITETEKLKTLETLINRVAKAATKRNEIAHAQWTLYTYKDRPTELARAPIRPNLLDGLHDIYTRDKMKQTLEQFKTLNDDLHTFIWPLTIQKTKQMMPWAKFPDNA